MGLNLAVLLEETAERHPDRLAFKLDSSELTYRQLEEASARFASVLTGRGIRPGDRVALMMPNVLEFPIVYFGILKAGGVVVPMNILLKEREVAYYLQSSGASVFVAWSEYLEHALAGSRAAELTQVIVARPLATPADEELPSLDLLIEEAPRIDTLQREPGDVAVILYTSGTTGKSKGASLTHSNLLWNAQISATTLTLFAPDDIVLGALPLFHTYAETLIMNAAVYSGSAVVVMTRFEARRALDLIESERVTVFGGVPTMFTALLQEQDVDQRDLSRLRMSVSGGAAIPVETLLQFEAKFGCPVLEGYGLSECSPVVSYNHPDRPRKPGSIGTPIWGVEMRLVSEDGTDVDAGDVGEIAVRGHCVMAGYHELPDATAEAISDDGWLFTGDLARKDDEGYYYIVDRKKEMIIRGGYNVYPRELEEVLHEHSCVIHAAVVGVPHPELGEEVAAAVVAKPGAGIDADELQQFIRDRVAAYKYPRVVAVFDALPLGPTGKILKKEIDRQELFTRAGMEPFVDVLVQS